MMHDTVWWVGSPAAEQAKIQDPATASFRDHEYEEHAVRARAVRAGCIMEGDGASGFLYSIGFDQGSSTPG
jgi:hypothetical protein